MSGATFVSVGRDDLLGELVAIGTAISMKGGSYEQGVSGREVVVDFFPPGARVVVRVYTSLAQSASVARGSGEDAVRILVGALDATGFRILEPSLTVHRTAPRGLPDPERVAAFLGRLRGRVREAYRLAVKRPPCPLCGRALARRFPKAGGSQFLGCTGFPECTGTRATHQRAGVKAPRKR